MNNKIVIIILALLITAVPTVSAKPPSANLDQVRNGPASAPYVPIEWQNGNLNAQHSHYVEGYSVPYRVIMTDLPISTTIILTIGYDIKDQGKHALDYLTYFDYIDDPSHVTTFGHTQETINPLQDVSGVSGTTTTYAIPAPSSSGSPVTGQPTDSFNALPAGKNLMTLYGGTITNIVYSDQGDLNAAHDEARVSITFSVDSSTAVLAWGGHIASRDDWGYDSESEPMSAGAINGSPYHMRLIDWTLNNLGNQDRSLKIVESTEDPGRIIVEKQTIPDGDPEVFEFTSDTLGSFSLSDDESITFNGLDPGTYDVSETTPDGWTLSDITVSDGSPIDALVLSAGETITVTFTNTKLSKIWGYKWNDLNGDGVMDDNEPKLEGWTIQLYKDRSLTPIASTTTNINGYYEFSNLDTGLYLVAEVLQSGWIQTYPAGTSHLIEISVPSNWEANFGNQEEPTTGTIIVKKIVELGKSSEYTNEIMFEFTGDASGFIGDGEQIIVSNLDPGIYHVTENNMGWTTTIEIIDPDSGSSYNGLTVTIDLDAGETVEVIYTNSPPDFVIPETPIGTIATFLVMLAAITLLRNSKTLNPVK